MLLCSISILIKICLTRVTIKMQLASKSGLAPVIIYSSFEYKTKINNLTLKKSSMNLNYYTKKKKFENLL